METRIPLYCPGAMHLLGRNFMSTVRMRANRDR